MTIWNSDSLVKMGEKPGRKIEFDWREERKREKDCVEGLGFKESEFQYKPDLNVSR